jgi:beta-glucosidase
MFEGFAPDVEFKSGYHMWGGGVEKVDKLSDVASGKVGMDDFLSQLSDRMLADLLGGQPNTGLADTFGFGNLPIYGIPSIMTADGPAGLRFRPDRGVFTTAWPSATLLASTWDPEIIEEVGYHAGLEVKENNIGFWLTPAVNIHRSPLCGRNFEYYSEDPYLTGKLASAMVRGIQSNRIGVSLKHFALNNKETNRKQSDSRASERAIREIYLKAFEIVVKEADPWTIMSSYNIINSHRASENRELLQDILRDEWDFKGFVTTDWWTAGEHYKELLAGNDIKMGRGYPERLMEALEKGLITRENMLISVKRMLNVLLRFE